MRKVAIFVEGQTELHFVNRMVTEIAGYGKVRVDLWIHRGGKYSKLRSEGPPEDVADVLVMLVNCCGDGSVKSSILERRELLAAQNFEVILGLMDLYPKTLEELDVFEAGLKKGLDFPGQTIRIFLAVAEVEAWFLSEFSHFEKLDPSLGLGRVKTDTGFDPITQNVEQTVRHPAGKLKEIYSLAGILYRKREAETHRLVSILDYTEIYTSVRDVSQSLDRFITGLESVICSPQIELVAAEQ